MNRNFGATAASRPFYLRLNAFDLDAHIKFFWLTSPRKVQIQIKGKPRAPLLLLRTHSITRHKRSTERAI